MVLHDSHCVGVFAKVKLRQRVSNRDCEGQAMISLVPRKPGNCTNRVDVILGWALRRVSYRHLYLACVGIESDSSVDSCCITGYPIAESTGVALNCASCWIRNEVQIHVMGVNQCCVGHRSRIRQSVRRIF